MTAIAAARQDRDDDARDLRRGRARRDARHHDLGALRPAERARLVARRRRRGGDVTAALAAAARTAARLAVAVGPGAGPRGGLLARAVPRDLPRRVPRRAGRAARTRSSSANRAHFDGLLPLALVDAGHSVRAGSGARSSRGSSPRERKADPALVGAGGGGWARRSTSPAWRARPTTFDGAARYAAWKIERHTGRAGRADAVARAAPAARRAGRGCGATGARGGGASAAD